MRPSCTSSRIRRRRPSRRTRGLSSHHTRRSTCTLQPQPQQYTEGCRRCNCRRSYPILRGQRTLRGATTVQPSHVDAVLARPPPGRKYGIEIRQQKYAWTARERCQSSHTPTKRPVAMAAIGAAPLTRTAHHASRPPAIDRRPRGAAGVEAPAVGRVVRLLIPEHEGVDLVGVVVLAAAADERLGEAQRDGDVSSVHWPGSRLNGPPPHVPVGSSGGGKNSRVVPGRRRARGRAARRGSATRRVIFPPR